MNQTFKRFVTTFVLSISLFLLSDTKVLANAFNFNSSTGPNTFTCYASDLGCEQVNHVYFINASGEYLWQTTAWTSSPNNMLEYYSWTKDYTWEQDTNPSQQPIESHLGVILPVRMKNNGIPGTYQGTLYVDAKTCNRAVTPWDCYFRGAASYTMTMTVIADPTATPRPTTPPPTATPTTRPPSATATPTLPQPSLTPTPTTSAIQSSPTPTAVLNPTSTPNQTGGSSESTSTTSIKTATATSTAPQAKPPKCTVTTPNAPKLLSVVPLTQTSVMLEWTKIDQATHYAVSFGTQSSSYTFGVPNTGNTTSFVIGQLSPNTNYFFVLQAINDCAPSKLSNEVVARTTTSLPESAEVSLVEIDAQTGIETTPPAEEVALVETIVEEMPQTNSHATTLFGGAAFVSVSIASILVAIKKGFLTIPNNWKTIISLVQSKLFFNRK